MVAQRRRGGAVQPLSGNDNTLPLPGTQHHQPVDRRNRMRIIDTHRALWRAGCVEMRTSGSGSGQGKPTGGDTGRASLADFHWTLLKEDEGAKFLYRPAKAARKRRAGVAVVTQDAADLLGSDLGQAVIANAATQILMRQAPQAIDLIAETFALTGGEARMLLAAGRGEALLLAGSHRVAFQTGASAREHQLCAGLADLIDDADL